MIALEPRAGETLVHLSDFTEEGAVSPTTVEEAKRGLRDPARLVWVDILDEDGSAEPDIKALSDGWEELAGLDPVRAARHEADPTQRPPKAKTFRDFIFARTYVLNYDEELGQLVAQEIHVMAGRTFAITIRYPSLAWDMARMASGSGERPFRIDTPGLNLGKLMTEIQEFRDRVPRGDSNKVFGLEVAAVVLDGTIDSTFDSLDKLRKKADAIEQRVLKKQEWLWGRNSWPGMDNEILAFRRMLRRVRWAFMPADEIIELLSGPFLVVPRIDPGVRFRVDDLGREATRAVEAARDVATQVEHTVAVRDSFKSDRLNRTTYVLATVTTVLLVPTLVVGFYGMNFANIPGLGTEAGYIWAAVAMIVLAAALWFGIQAYLRHETSADTREDEGPPPGTVQSRAADLDSSRHG